MNNFLENKLYVLISYIIMLIIIIFFSILSFYFYNHKSYIPCNCDNIALDDVGVKQANDYVYVEIKGAVNKPGVYQVENNKRINDIIKLAEGFKKDAYTDNINLSKKISDELVIYVYTKEEIKSNKSEIASDCNVNSYVINECTEGKVSIITSNENGSEVNNSSNNKLVNINTASIKELITLPGIGESKAQNIINYRNEVGSFQNIEEIKNVNGIGDATFEQLKEFITI